MAIRTEEEQRFEMPLVPVFHAAVPFLRVCKQVSTEASTVLYRNNTFTLARPWVDHDVWNRATVDRAILHVTEPWLKAIGRYYRELRHVEIDISLLHNWRVSQLRNHGIGRKPEVARLMRYLWCDGVNFQISIVQVSCESVKKLTKTAADFSNLNNTIALLQQGCLKLKAWRIAIYSMGIESSGQHGTVVSVTSPKDRDQKINTTSGRYMAYTDEVFEFTSDGEKTLTRYPTEQLARASRHMPYGIKQRIFNYACTYDKIQKLSISNKSNISKVTQIAEICRRSDAYARNSGFDIELETSYKKASFSSWAELGEMIRWANEKADWRRPFRLRCGREVRNDPRKPIFESGHNTGCTMVSNLSPGTEVQIHPEDVTFDAIPFLHYTVFMSGEVPLNVDIRRVSTNTTVRRSNLKLHDLRKRALENWSPIPSAGDKINYPEI